MDDPEEYPHVPHCAIGGFVTVNPGDTLWSLARRYNTTVQAILAANPGINLDVLHIGQLVCIPVAPGRPFPAPCANGSPYTVQPGDNFYAIAQRHHISLDALLAANPGVNPDRLQVGQQICIPTAPPPPTTCPGPTYTIRPGDTLYRLAQSHGTTVEAIISANPGINPNALRVGQVLCLPPSGVSCAGGTVYRVRPGDTLYGIASRFAVTVAGILHANPGLSINSILYPGQAICVPGRGV
jgi:LysM repeat protein